MLITPWSDSFGCAALNNTLNASAQALSLVSYCVCKCVTTELHKAVSHPRTHFCLAVRARNYSDEDQVNVTADKHMRKHHVRATGFSCMLKDSSGLLQFDTYFFL